jgi:thymidylate synthase (FAD)
VGQIGGAEEASLEIREHCNKTIELYSNLLEKGVAPEVARCVLPQGMYTEFIETGSLAAYARIARLRTDPSAQREIQLYARGVMSLLTPHFPVSWAALTATSE